MTLSAWLFRLPGLEKAQVFPGLISGVSSVQWQCCCYDIAATKLIRTWLGWYLLYEEQSSVLIASSQVHGESVCVCKNAFDHTCSHMCALTHKQTHMHTMHTWTQLNSISPVERCNSSSGMRSTQENGSLLWCVPPAPKYTHRSLQWHAHTAHIKYHFKSAL